MKKVQLGEKTVQTTTMKILGGYEITVRKSLTIAEQVNLISNYIETYFLTPEKERTIQGMSYDPLAAETGLIFGVLEYTTNIDMDDLPVSLVFETEFYKQIFEAITNYESFMKRLDLCVKIIDKEVERQKSLGGVVDIAMQKILKTLENFENLDAEHIEQIADSIGKLGESIKDSKISNLMDKQ